MDLLVPNDLSVQFYVSIGCEADAGILVPSHIYIDSTEFLPCSNRCDQGTCIWDDLRHNFFLLNIFRDKKNKVLRGTESNRALVFCLFYREALHRLSCQEDSLVGKVGKRPFIEFGGILEVLILTGKCFCKRAVTAQHNSHDTRFFSLADRHQAISCRLGKTGLNPDNAVIDISVTIQAVGTHQSIGIMDVKSIRPVVCSSHMVIRRSADVCEQRVRHCLSGNQIKVIGTGKMPLSTVEHPAGIIKMGADAVELICPFIHQVDKGTYTPCHMHGDGIAGVVGRMYECTVNQVFKQESLTRLDLRVGRADIQPLQHVRLCSNLIIQTDTPVFNSFHSQKACHNLGKACDGVKLVFIYLIEDGVGVHVHYEHGISALEMRRFYCESRHCKARQ